MYSSTPLHRYNIMIAIPMVPMNTHHHHSSSNLQQVRHRRRKQDDGPPISVTVTTGILLPSLLGWMRHSIVRLTTTGSIVVIFLLLIHETHGWTALPVVPPLACARRRRTSALLRTPITHRHRHRHCRRSSSAFVPTTTHQFSKQTEAEDIPTPTTTTSTTASAPEEDEEECVLSDVDTRVLRAMLQEEKFIDTNDTEELRKLLERGTVKTTKKTKTATTDTSNSNDDPSAYSSQVLKTLTDTKLWKKISVQANDILESVSIWVSNKVEQDVKVLAALSLFAWDRVQQDVARALPSSSSKPGTSQSTGIVPKQLLLLTNASAYEESMKQQPSENIRETMNRPQDEIKSVSRELFAILSGERTNFQQQKQRQQQQQQQQRGLRTVAPAGTAYSGERQRRALQQKRKIEQSKKNIATNIGSNVVDSVWELRQEMKSEVNVPGYKTKPIRQAIAASAMATNNLLQGVRERAQLVAAATIRQQQTENELLLSEQQQQEQTAVIESLEVVDVGISPITTLPEKFSVLFHDICSERERIMNQLTTCINSPTESWLSPEIVDTFDTVDFITSPGMQNSITKMILLRDEISKNHHYIRSDKMDDTTMIQRPAFDAAVNDLLAIRTAIDYLYNCTVQDVSELVAEEIRYYIFLASSETNNKDKTAENVPLILRIEEEVLTIEQAQLEQQQQLEQNEDEIVIDSKKVSVVTTDVDSIRNTAPPTRQSDILDVISDAELMDLGVPKKDSNDRKVDTLLDNDYGSIASTGYVAELVSEDDFDCAVGNSFKQVYTVNEDKELSEETQSPNLLLVLVLRSLDVVLFVTEKVLTVGIPGTLTVVTNVMTRIDDMNRLGLGTKGWKELGNIAKAKGRY